MTNFTNSVLYTGFTCNLPKRIYEHQNKLIDGFSKKYNTIKCIYFEAGDDYDGVLAREKQIKNWRRDKKERIINEFNPTWEDLYDQICE